MLQSIAKNLFTYIFGWPAQWVKSWIRTCIVWFMVPPTKYTVNRNTVHEASFIIIIVPLLNSKLLTQQKEELSITSYYKAWWEEVTWQFLGDLPKWIFFFWDDFLDPKLLQNPFFWVFIFRRINRFSFRVLLFKPNNWWAMSVLN